MIRPRMMPGSIRSIRAVGAVGALAALSLVMSLPTASGRAATGGASAGTTELVYVANADSGPVTAYPSSSSGAVSPSRRNDDPNDPNTYWDPWGVAFDPGRHLYVQTFLSDATSFVFGPRARGNDPPKRIFVGGAPDTRSIAVDGLGHEYIATGQSSVEIDVLPPGAEGQPGDFYHVAPLRTIPTDEATWFPWPDILTTDPRTEVLAAVVRSQGNAVEVFQGGPQGPSSPLRIIAGSRTQLGTCPGGGRCDQMSVGYSALTGRIYVAVSSGTTTRVCEFAGDAHGNAAPLRIIEGSATRFAGMVITGIAVGPRTGEIFVMVKRGQFGSGEIDVFARRAGGNVAPTSSFTDATSGFVDAQGIAITG